MQSSNTSLNRGSFAHPVGRKLIFGGDLVDRGPKVPEVVRLLMETVKAGHAFCVPGNHDIKFMRALVPVHVTRDVEWPVLGPFVITEGQTLNHGRLNYVGRAEGEDVPGSPLNFAVRTAHPPNLLTNHVRPERACRPV